MPKIKGTLQVHRIGRHSEPQVLDFEGENRKPLPAAFRGRAPKESCKFKWLALARVGQATAIALPM